MCSNDDSIILDFFAGSGTTGQAVLQLNKEFEKSNRKFILATSNEITDTSPNRVVIDVTSKRLKRIMTGCCYDGNSNFPWINNHDPYGDSLDVYTLTETSVYDKEIFSKIDETLYGKNRFENLQEKIEWVCSKFEKVARRLEDATRD